MNTKKRGSINFGIPFSVTAILVTLIMVITAIGSQPVLADGNDDLNQSFNLSVYGDVTSAGVGLRGTGEGTISVSGIPSGATIEMAFLYWATIGSDNVYDDVTLDDTPVDGELIGTTDNTCWPGNPNNFVYRADITSLLPHPGNGNYTIEGLPADLSAGNDSQGASIVVVYSSPGGSLRSVIINDGAVALHEGRPAYTDTISGFTISGDVENAQITYLVGDGQESDGVSDYTSGAITYNGSSPLVSDVFNGTDGAYWDTYTLDVSSRTDESPAITTVNYDDPTDNESPDCLLWAATIFSVSQEDELSEFERMVIHGDVTAAGVGLRGTGQGDLQITGVPDGAQVVKSYLYWATIGDSNEFDDLTVDNTSIQGEHIATSGDTCWAGLNNNFVYRADLSGLIPGNGVYTIDGLPDDLLGSGNDSQGASLVVIYTGPPTEYPLRTIMIHDGAVTLDLVNNTYTDSFTDFDLDSPVTDAHITYLIGDGQSTWQNDALSFEGISIGDGLFNGEDGEHWGTINLDVTPYVVNNTATTTIDNNVDPSESPDCLLWASTIFSITAPQPDYDVFLNLPIIPDNYVSD